MSDLWAITCYFNPMGYERRQSNYRLFRRHLGVPLITVEWAWSRGAGFQLGPSDADVLIQVMSPDLMFQKERLLNLAMQALPSSCRYVAQLDCDVVFSNADWPRATIDLLNEYPFLHLLGTAYDLGPNDQPDPLAATRSLPALKSIVRSPCPQELLLENLRLKGYSNGFAWAARVELWRAHGFYDACIVGGGARAITLAVYGLFEAAVEHMHMNERWAQHYKAWAEPFHRTVQGRIGSVPCTVYHLWHGDLLNRRYVERHRGLRQYNFDPTADLTMDAEGCWRWASQKREMHRYVHDYFKSRREDG
jgi:hypothetical protein